MAAYPMSIRMTSKAPYFESMVRRIDAPPVQSVYQVTIGFLVVPAFARAIGAVDWRLVPFFLAVLAAVRAVPAVLRHALPFSSELKAHWFRQRVLAKRYDSYQWRKLFWFGVGLTSYVVMFDRGGLVGGALAAVCLAAGALGFVFWRRVRRSLTAPVAPQGR
jgi:hypothetical protein